MVVPVAFHSQLFLQAMKLALNLHKTCIKKTHSDRFYSLMVDSHESSSIKGLGVSDGPKINIAILTNL